MTSFTPVPRVSLRSPKGLDYGEATFTRIHFYSVYKTHGFEKLENILLVTHIRAIWCGRGTPNLHVFVIATQGRCVGRDPLQGRQALGAANRLQHSSPLAMLRHRLFLTFVKG